MSNSNGENNVGDRFRVCAFVFVNKRRKRNLDGEFLKKFDQVCFARNYSSPQCNYVTSLGACLHV